MLDKGDIQKVQGRGPPGQVWGPLRHNQQVPPACVVSHASVFRNAPFLSSEKYRHVRNNLDLNFCVS